VRNYFTDYEYRLEIARRYPVLARVVVLSVIFVGLASVPVVALWPLSTGTTLVFGATWLLCVASGLGYYVLFERNSGAASSDAGSSPQGAGKQLAVGSALWVVWFVVLWASSSWPWGLRIVVLVVAAVGITLVMRRVRLPVQRSG
jgi:hypothetical protein